MESLMVTLMQESLQTGMEDRPHEIAAINGAYNELMSILQESDIHKFSERITQFQDNKANLKNLQYKYILEANALRKSKFSGRKVSIKIPVQRMTNSYELIPFKGSVGIENFEGVVACANWGALAKQGINNQVDIFDHLDQLLIKENEIVPKEGKANNEGIGLITFQNGINNKPTDFTAMGESILNQLEDDEKPLCIGIYNPAKGVISDLLGVLAGLNGNLSDTICSTCELFNALAVKLPHINPHLLWAHFSHSEGGLIAKAILTMLEKRSSKDYLQKHLLTSTYGGVLPISKQYAKYAVNTYSTADTATWPRVQSYLADLGTEAENYTIVPVAPAESAFQSMLKPDKEQFKKMSPGERCIYIPLLCAAGIGSLVLAQFAKYYTGGGDHAFQGTTYQTALANNVKTLRKRFTFYNGKILIKSLQIDRQ